MTRIHLTVTCFPILPYTQQTRVLLSYIPHWDALYIDPSFHMLENHIPSLLPYTLKSHDPPYKQQWRAFPSNTHINVVYIPINTGLSCVWESGRTHNCRLYGGEYVFVVSAWKGRRACYYCMYGRVEGTVTVWCFELQKKCVIKHVALINMNNNIYII